MRDKNSPPTGRIVGARTHRAISVLGYWAAQQALACLAPMLACELLIFPWIGWNEYRSPVGNIGFQVTQALAIGAGGCTLGLVMGRHLPWTRPTGHWIWVLPVSLLALAIGWDLRLFGTSVVLPDYFFDVCPGRTEGPLGREALTYPAWSSVWYSLGVLLAKHRGGRTEPAVAVPK